MNRADIADYLGPMIETVGNTFTSLRGSYAIRLLAGNLVLLENFESLFDSPTAAKGTTEPSLLLHCSKCSK